MTDMRETHVGIFNTKWASPRDDLNLINDLYISVAESEKTLKTYILLQLEREL